MSNELTNAITSKPKEYWYKKFIKKDAMKFTVKDWNWRNKDRLERKVEREQS